MTEDERELDLQLGDAQVEILELKKENEILRERIQQLLEVSKISLDLGGG